MYERPTRHTLKIEADHVEASDMNEGYKRAEALKLKAQKIKEQGKKTVQEWLNKAANLEAADSTKTDKINFYKAKAQEWQRRTEKEFAKLIEDAEQARRNGEMIGEKRGKDYYTIRQRRTINEQRQFERTISERKELQSITLPKQEDEIKPDWISFNRELEFDLFYKVDNEIIDEAIRQGYTIVDKESAINNYPIPKFEQKVDKDPNVHFRFIKTPERVYKAIPGLIMATSFEFKKFLSPRYEMYGKRAEYNFAFVSAIVEISKEEVDKYFELESGAKYAVQRTYLLGKESEGDKTVKKVTKDAASAKEESRDNWRDNVIKGLQSPLQGGAPGLGKKK